MNRMAMTSRLVSVAILGVFLAFTAMAGPITVVNFSFETVPSGGFPFGCGIGCSFSTAAIPGWVTGAGTAPAGEFRPGPGQFNTLLTPPTIAYSNGPTISQTVLPPGGVIPGDVYTLTVDLGHRKDFNIPFRASADLLINGHHSSLAGGITPGPGNWSTFTADYTAVASDALASITIELFSVGSQADFDNVRLSFAAGTTTPEPAAVTLIGLGLIGMAVFARRKRTS